MNIKILLLLTALNACLFLTACKSGPDMPYISDLPKFTNLYGHKFFFKKGVGVHWINRDRNKDGPAHYLVVTIDGSFDDPYTIKKVEYLPGGRFEVVGVRLCTLCFPDEIMYEVKLQGLHTEAPVFLADNRSEFKTSFEEDGVVTFNPEVIGLVTNE